MFAELFGPEQLIILGQIIFIDLVLAGDNAIIIGMVASYFPPDLRYSVLFSVFFFSVILIILFTFFTSFFLLISFLRLIVLFLLLFLFYKLYTVVF